VWASMGLIDTHLHLDGFARKGELPGILSRAKASGIEGMIAIGTEPDDWGLHRDIALQNPGYVFYTVGLHPCTVALGWEKAVEQIEAYWSGDGLKPVALGECGLDRFHLPKAPAEAAKVFAWQISAFERQLAIARGLGCPVVVHSRGAFPEAVALIDASGVDWTKVVFHCFSEGAAEIAVLKGKGGYGSFTGILTYKNAENVRAAAKAQGPDRFMVETDAPFLAPAPHRGKPNEPAWVRHVAEQAAVLFEVPLPEIEQKSRDLSRRFFGLGEA
jgi:TatD DNase family protein